MFRILIQQIFRDEITGYVITDSPAENLNSKWPHVATFPVSVRFDQDIQHKRAKEYVEYLNRNIVVPPAFGT